MSGQPFTFAEICRVLVREPFHLRPWEIERLTDRQLAEVYFAEPPKKEGEEGGAGQSAYEIFRDIWRARGWDDESIEKKWKRDYPEETKAG